MAKTFTANIFSVSSLRQLKKDLTEYRNSLQFKLETFVKILLDEGIKVAWQHSEDIPGALGSHKMGEHVSFMTEPIETSEGTVYGVLLGRGDTITGMWYENDGEGGYRMVSDTINALLVLEFGTAAMALPQQDAFGVTAGQGTKSKRGHEDDFAWKIITKVSNGKPVAWKTATAIQPTQPMYHAGLAMFEKIQEAAKIAFK